MNPDLESYPTDISGIADERAMYNLVKTYAMYSACRRMNISRVHTVPNLFKELATAKIQVISAWIAGIERVTFYNFKKYDFLGKELANVRLTSSWDSMIYLTLRTSYLTRTKT